MLTTVRGHATEVEAAVHMQAATRAYERRIRVHHFFDLEHLERYVSAARTTLTDFAVENRDSVASATFLVRSKMVAMGVSTAALALRLVGVEFYVLHDRATFEARIDERVQGR